MSTMYCYGIIYTLCTETKHTTTVNLRDKYPDALYDRVTAHWTAGYRAGAVETTTNVTTIQQYHVRLLRKKKNVSEIRKKIYLCHEREK